MQWFNEILVKRNFAAYHDSKIPYFAVAQRLVLLASSQQLNDGIALPSMAGNSLNAVRASSNGPP